MAEFLGDKSTIQSAEFRKPKKPSRLKKLAIAAGGAAAAAGTAIAAKKLGGGAVLPTRSMGRGKSRRMVRGMPGTAPRQLTGRSAMPGARRPLALPAAGQTLGSGLARQRRRVAMSASTNTADFIGYEQGVALRRRIGSGVKSAKSKTAALGGSVGKTRAGSAVSGAAKKVGGFVKRNPVKAGAIGAGAYLGYKAVKAGAKRVLGMGKKRPQGLRNRIKNAFS